MARHLDYRKVQRDLYAAYKSGALSYPPDTDKIARAICREKCAFMGEPPCFEVEAENGEKEPWPNPYCDEPGCLALAAAVAEALGRQG